MLDDLKDIFGKKGLLIVGVGAAALFVISILSEKNSSRGEMTQAVGYTSYPDAVTNANVIIDSVNEYSDFNTQQILDNLNGWGGMFGDSFEKLQENMTNEFNDVDAGFESVAGKLDLIQDSLAKKTTSAVTSAVSGATSTVTGGNKQGPDGYEYEWNGPGTSPIKPVTNLGEANGSVVILNGKPVTATATLKKAGN